MACNNACVAVFEHYEKARQAVDLLVNSGCETAGMSLIGCRRQQDRRSVGYYHDGLHAGFSGDRDSFWNSLQRILPGAALFWMPQLGVVMVAGPLVRTLSTAVAGEVEHGAGCPLDKVLYEISIPEDSIVRYEAALLSGHYLLVVQGDQQVIEQAHEVLVKAWVDDIAIHLG